MKTVYTNKEFERDYGEKSYWNNPSVFDGYDKHITIKSYAWWKKVLEKRGYMIAGKYNWAKKGLYYPAKLTNWSYFISQMNVICRLANN